MSSKTIPLDKVHSVIAQINLSPQLEELLNEYSMWCSYQKEDWEVDFCDSLSGTQAGTLYEFLTENNIGIRPSGFEFYLTGEDSGNAEESEHSKCSEVVGQK